MALLILDPAAEAAFRATRPGIDDERWTEVWDGVTVMSPIANNEHQRFVNRLGRVLAEVVEDADLGSVYQGVNLTDRTPNWLENFRNPDVVVYLHTNAAIDLDTHYLGGPDLAVEVLSPGERPTAKFAFYAGVGTREVLLVHRDPWRLELFALAAGALQLVGASDLAAPAVVPSAALGVTFQLVPGAARPQVAVTHPASGGAWAV